MSFLKTIATLGVYRRYGPLNQLIFVNFLLLVKPIGIPYYLFVCSCIIKLMFGTGCE